MTNDNRKDAPLTRRGFLLKSAAGAAAMTVAGRIARAAEEACCPAAAACEAKASCAAAGPEGAAGKKGDWKVLFDGENLDAWDVDKKSWSITEDGELHTTGKGRDIYSKEKFQDFMLDLEFKVTPGCNSGVFIRMASRKDWLHSSIEIQVLDSFGKKPNKHTCGALYDLKAPDANAVRKAGEWNRYQIVCHKNRIFVALNGVEIQNVDLNKWDTAHKNPDGSKNKFKNPIKEITHAGHIALQTHGKPLWYRNIKIKPVGKLGKCPVCGAEGPEGWYCAKCKAVCTTMGEFPCKKNADKKMTAGTYCPKSNRFRFPATAPKCGKCGKEMGVWCSGCGSYAMTIGVTYDKDAKKPVPKTPKNIPAKKK